MTSYENYGSCLASQQVGRKSKMRQSQTRHRTSTTSNVCLLIPINSKWVEHTHTRHHTTRHGTYLPSTPNGSNINNLSHKSISINTLHGGPWPNSHSCAVNDSWSNEINDLRLCVHFGLQSSEQTKRLADEASVRRIKIIKRPTQRKFYLRDEKCITMCCRSLFSYSFWLMLRCDLLTSPMFYNAMIEETKRKWKTSSDTIQPPRRQRRWQKCKEVVLLLTNKKAISHFKEKATKKIERKKGKKNMEIHKEPMSSDGSNQLKWDKSMLNIWIPLRPSVFFLPRKWKKIEMNSSSGSGKKEWNPFSHAIFFVVIREEEERKKN